MVQMHSSPTIIFIYILMHKFWYLLVVFLSKLLHICWFLTNIMCNKWYHSVHIIYRNSVKWQAKYCLVLYYSFKIAIILSIFTTICPIQSNLHVTQNSWEKLNRYSYSSISVHGVVHTNKQITQNSWRSKRWKHTSLDKPLLQT
jgi:hypothetical protein